jgi:lambda family phage portal protein
LTDDFRGSELSADASLLGSLDKLRARSRQLWMSNPYASRFVQMVVGNVLGRDGIRMEAQVLREDGTLDEKDSLDLEAMWGRWSRPEYCSMNGRLSFLDIQKLALSTMARDGEVLIRVHNPADSEFGFALQVIECDKLLTGANKTLDGGNRLNMSIEQDAYGRPIAYWLADVPIGGEYISANPATVKTIRVPAEEIVHLYLFERPEQSRGIPWMAQSMRGLHMTESYREAELVAARVAASKMAFYTSSDGQGYTGDDITQDGSLVFEAEAGLIEQLPAGMDLQTLDWSHPNSNVGDFVKSCLRGVSSGLNISYNALSNDLEGVNFSSIRAGVQEERETWKSLQSFMIGHLIQPIFDKWLARVILEGAVPFPPRKIDKFKSVVWRPRGFSYVDPAKDNQAFAKAVQLGVMSRTEIAASQGKDFKETLATLAQEERLAYEAGVNISPRQTMPIYPAMVDPEQASGPDAETDDQIAAEDIAE